jgi:tetratricopeptide (TPR) repeat protein
MYLLTLESEAQIKNAIDKFNEAIVRDPQYAQPHCGLAMAYYELSSVYEAPREPMTKVRASAEEAIRLDPGLAEAYVILGLVAQRHDWNWKEAQAEFERALECNPKSDFARQQYATSLALTGQLDDALSQLSKAKILNPTSKEIETELGLLALYRGDYDEAGKMFEEAITAGFSPAHHYNGILLVAQDRIEDGIKELEAARKAQTSAVDPVLLGALGYAYAKAGDEPQARKILAQLAVPSEINPYVCKPAIAIVHIGLNDKDAAFACLDEAVVDRDEYLLWLKVDPFFEPLKSDPRFQELCEKVFGEPP